MKYISVEYILKLHEKLISTTGGSDGVRDIELLKSSIENSKVTFDGEDLYKSIEEKCSNICYCIINNHTFIDGNKRSGIYVMLLLLEYNEIKLSFTQNELIDLGLGIAKGELKQKNIYEWIKSHKNVS
ncbi:type II toxin-antitoxin system death-on-curing family toxin [Clostridium estertheticum]|uniref:Death-on-curing protein n=3 Tax=Clostridium estertheticum TaxID=238834 RepID=A0A1J0GD20_9CLOT|nr:type II toxin-antitoxin system death-on-curing family toxin [Clostridium estertheticum]APC39249.1 death-on-curing protein [Clostridium estertheticum subsp. estertheticum]MBU3071903.1 type II toxin-antitoxin system death-on-curing family toxin [Clostridium estertheticum]MBU3161995.1 type II toxin-antitoxin system death-on-curing family toxin [Clostridium estertheticum]MBU3171170.1 type II toxin-antitoxin system death-on-curing family toxin [Clostridium estertheticum]MBU3179503.1 type II toxi